jgi:hypothetical protein
VNYGIRPDGSKDFPELPAGLKPNHKNIMIFGWKEVPDSWNKFRDIALYWTAKG